MSQFKSLDEIETENKVYNSMIIDLEQELLKYNVKDTEIAEIKAKHYLAYDLTGNLDKPYKLIECLIDIVIELDALKYQKERVK
jgi:hypothetical protein